MAMLPNCVVVGKVFRLSLPDSSVFVGWRCPEIHSTNFVIVHPLHFHRLALVDEGRVAGDDEQARDLGECHDDIFRNRAADGVRATANGPLSLPGRRLLRVLRGKGSRKPQVSRSIMAIPLSCVGLGP